MQFEPVAPCWSGTCVVAATGPSLTEEVAEQCKGVTTLVVNDAYRMLPWADALYAADTAWWKRHEGCQGFEGEKWIPHSNGASARLAKDYGLKIVNGTWKGGFSLDPMIIHYGERGTGNSGFQGVNLAILKGAKRIILVGFDMREVKGQKHFFGNHPKGLNQKQKFGGWVKGFTDATVPDGVEIINATPDSALKCFPTMSLRDALSLS